MTETTVINPPTMPEVFRWDEPQFLAGKNDFSCPASYVQHVSARIYGYLIQTVQPIIKHYYADLFHDAITLRRYIEEWDSGRTLTFYYHIGDTGTFITKDDDLALKRQFNFKCAVYVDNRDRIVFTMRRLKDYENV